MAGETGPDKLRLFAAVEIPEGWRAALTQAITALRQAGGNEYKWVRPELMHVTLAFMGYQDAARLDTVYASLEASASRSPAFTMHLGRLGTFGPPHAISVVWAGIIPDNSRLESLHAAVSEELVRGNIGFDRKPLVPHVTLARGRRPVDREASIRLATEIGRGSLPDLAAPITDIVLFRSRLGPTGPSYDPLRRFPLRDG